MNFRKRQKLAALNGDLEVLADAGKYEIEEVKVVKQKLACEILGLAEGNANEGGLEGLFESPIIPCTTHEDINVEKPQNLKFMPRPTGLASVNALFSEPQLDSKPGSSSSQKADVSGTLKGWPAATAIEIFDYTSGGGQALLLCSTAIACARTGLSVIIYDSTNSIKATIFDKFISSLANLKDNDMYQTLKNKTGELYEAIKVVHVNDIWDLIDKLILLRSSRTGSQHSDENGYYHFVAVLGLSRMIAEMDPHLLYQTLADRQISMSSNSSNPRKKVINCGESSLRALLHRLGIAIRGLTAKGSTVIAFSTPIDAEHHTARRFNSKGQQMANLSSTEGFVCQHDAFRVAAHERACSCAIVRMALIRIFHNVFDITMDLITSPVSNEKDNSIEMILSFRSIPKFAFGDEKSRQLHCMIRNPSDEFSV